MPGVSRCRSVPVDVAKTAAICGTLLIHASAAGGFAWPLGSANWIAALAWNSVLRCAVPVFFLCSGALLLPPEKEVTVHTIWRKYIPRILVALFCWAAAYAAWDLLLTWHRTGVLEATAVKQALVDLLLFHHKSHLYYLHIILLVYAVLPLTRLFAAKADAHLLGYALGLWFVLSSVLPAVKGFPPFSAIGGIPQQYPISLTWGAVGYGLLGFALDRWAARWRSRTFVMLYLAGFAVTFGLTWWMSLGRGALYQGFLQGSAPGVCLQAAGLYGFCVTRFSTGADCPVAKTVSKASFCIYLVHLFVLDFLTSHGFSTGVYSPLWAVPVLTAVMFAAGFLAWCLLRRIPVVNRYLI